jgi:hypothetical protein
VAVVEVNGSLDAGDVVVRKGRVFLVVAADQEFSTLVAITRAQGSHHRAEVRLQRWTEATLNGLHGADVVLRCDTLFSSRPGRAGRIGRLSGDIVDRAIQAISRERAARGVEQRDGPASSLIAATASSGRRVAAVRYA